MLEATGTQNIIVTILPYSKPLNFYLKISSTKDMKAKIKMHTQILRAIRILIVCLWTNRIMCTHISEANRRIKLFLLKKSDSMKNTYKIMKIIIVTANSRIMIMLDLEIAYSKTTMMILKILFIHFQRKWEISDMNKNNIKKRNWILRIFPMRMANTIDNVLRIMIRIIQIMTAQFSRRNQRVKQREKRIKTVWIPFHLSWNNSINSPLIDITMDHKKESSIFQRWVVHRFIPQTCIIT